MKKIFKWLRESNRYAHLLGGVAIGLGADNWYCAGYAGVGVASALELKDRMWGGCRLACGQSFFSFWYFTSDMER